jgi:hypothetical protein
MVCRMIWVGGREWTNQLDAIELRNLILITYEYIPPPPNSDAVTNTRKFSAGAGQKSKISVPLGWQTQFLFFSRISIYAGGPASVSRL